jgi:thiol-disulfide isomerase/thioredoxin
MVDFPPEIKGDLLDFFGTECVHCHEMDPLVERLEQELKVKVEHIEVWHNAKNAELLQKLDKGFCGGVPFFFNRKTGKWICGSTNYEKFKAWATGK